jgi:hypothetical protein
VEILLKTHDFFERIVVEVYVSDSGTYDTRPVTIGPIQPGFDLDPYDGFGKYVANETGLNPQVASKRPGKPAHIEHVWPHRQEIKAYDFHGFQSYHQLTVPREIGSAVLAAARRSFRLSLLDDETTVRALKPAQCAKSFYITAKMF